MIWLNDPARPGRFALKPSKTYFYFSSPTSAPPPSLSLSCCFSLPSRPYLPIKIPKYFERNSASGDDKGSQNQLGGVESVSRGCPSHQRRQLTGRRRPRRRLARDLARLSWLRRLALSACTPFFFFSCFSFILFEKKVANSESFVLGFHV